MLLGSNHYHQFLKNLNVKPSGGLLAHRGSLCVTPVPLNAQHPTGEMTCAHAEVSQTSSLQFLQTAGVCVQPMLLWNVTEECTCVAACGLAFFLQESRG